MRNNSFPLFVGVTLALAPYGAALLDRLVLGRSKPANPAAVGLGGALTQDQMVGGLKEALAKGVQQAVSSLGKPDGFLQDAGVIIPMPEQLQEVEKTLRTLRQDKLADEFVTTLNRAAEQAVPDAAAVLGEAVKQMSITDAKTILTGKNKAATQYFRRTSETNLYARFFPIVKAATEKAGVPGAYKRMTDKAGGGIGGPGGVGRGLLGKPAPDLEDYVTRETLDGLFLKIAEQEKLIRENPVARTTDLLQTVFGALGK
jgi:hypothetical protein